MRVVRRAEGGVVGLVVAGENRHVRLAEDDCPGFAQHRHCLRILRADALAIGRHAAAREHAGDIESILDRDREAFERARGVSQIHLLRLPGGGEQRFSWRKADDRVETGVDGVEPLQRAAQQLAGADRATLEERELRARGGEKRIAHPPFLSASGFCSSALKVSRQRESTLSRSSRSVPASWPTV